ncbi:protein YeeZ [Flavobacteriaceae bacterium UJ101]|nr:protein YeeZ [Flavobacteriaceae bacterium UJ101]
MKKIGILGCGWLGERLASYLLEMDYHVICTNSTSSKQKEIRSKGIPPLFLRFSTKKSMDFSNEFTKVKKEFETCDTVIISIPISKKDDKANTIQFENIIHFLSNNTHQQLFFFNSTRIYPSTNMLIDESFENKMLLDSPFYKTEIQLQKAFPSINILRLGGLFGDDRVFMKYFSNKVLQDGQTPVNHIHYRDICSIIHKMTHENHNQMIFNLVAPLHPSKEDVIKNQSNQYDYEKPSKIAYNKIPYKIISSQKLIQELNYSFIFPNPETF